MVPDAAVRQAGCFLLSQAADEGYTRRERDRLTRTGLWVGTGAVRRIADWPNDWASRAWHAALTTGGVLSGPSAVRVLGGYDIQGRQQVHVTVPPTSGLRHVPGVVVHRQPVAEHEIARLPEQPPATRGVRTVEDCAVIVGHVGTVIAVETLVRAGQLNVTELRHRCAQRGPWGTAKIGQALREANFLSESGLETELRYVLQPAFPRLSVQLEVTIEARTFRVDLADEPSRLAFEADGREYHPDEKFEYDHDRRLWLRRADWEPLEFTARQIRRTPSYVLRHALAARKLRLARQIF